jgi:hypothetical protein
MRYDYNELVDFFEENNIIPLQDYNKTDKINSFTIIEGNCINENCDSTFKKEFRSLLKTNGYCNECIKNIAKIKLKNTCLEKYGVEHTSKLDEIKEKVKKTSLERYGNECSLNNIEVKEKSKKTCLEKYGVEHCINNIEIKEKIKKSCFQKFGVESYSQTKEFKEKCKNTSLKNYGVDHHSKSQDFKEKYKETCIQKYGAESYNQTDIFKNKFKETFLTKYGVDSPFKVKEIVEKGKQTCLEKYGAEYYATTQQFKDDVKQTSLEKYGLEHYVKTPEFKEKYKETCLEKYGVENSSQNKEIMEKIIKNAHKRKNYIFPSGKIEQVQGAEPYALKCLIENENIAEEDIVVGCKNVPTIWYEDETGKKHRHYVDIFIPSQNRCIEVKSTWTAKINDNNIFLKQKAGKELGYLYEIWIYDSKGILVEKHV